MLLEQFADAAFLDVEAVAKAECLLFSRQNVGFEPVGMSQAAHFLVEEMQKKIPETGACQFDGQSFQKSLPLIFGSNRFAGNLDDDVSDGRKFQFFAVERFDGGQKVRGNFHSPVYRVA